MSKNTKWEVKTTVDKTSLWAGKVRLSSSVAGGAPTITVGGPSTYDVTDNAMSASWGIDPLHNNVARSGMLALYANPNNTYIRSISHSVGVSVTGTANWTGIYDVQDGELNAPLGIWTMVVISSTGSDGPVSSVDGNAGVDINFSALLRDAVRTGKF